METLIEKDFRSTPTEHSGSASLGFDPLMPRMVEEDTATCSRQSELLFAPRLDARLKVVVPFVVEIVESEDGISAYAREIEEFGFGENRSEALDDLGKTITELYFSLFRERDRLSGDLYSTLFELKKHIDRIHE